MALILDFNRYKSAGIYVEEYDNTTMSNAAAPDSLRLLVGFANKGIFNRPVYLQNDNDREKMFGEINTKLEHKGCFFNRMAKTMLSSAPILALNLLKVDDSISGPDQVNYAAMSLDAGTPNPVVISSGSAYGEYDYLANSVDADVYDTVEGDYVPYIGKTPYSSLFDRSRFWVPSETNLLARAASDLHTGDVASFEKTNFLNFANISTDEMSILVYKPEGLAGYSITAAEWYNGAENIPFGWIRPSDYMSEYFLTVIAVKGNWTNYPNLATDNIWGGYFDNKGILKSAINKFIGAEGVEMIGSWTGSIIPDFTDKQGNNQCLFNKINAATDRTGLMMSFNEDAAEVLAYDYNGANSEGEESGVGCWFFDIDGDRQMQANQGESASDVYLIDMIGHNFQKGFKNSEITEEGTKHYYSTSLNPAAIKGLATSKTFWLKPFDKLIENTAPAASGSFTAKGTVVDYDPSVDPHAPKEKFNEKVKYTFEYSAASDKVTLTVDPVEYLDVSVKSVYITRDNQADSDKVTDLVERLDSSAAVKWTISKVYSNDVVDVELEYHYAGTLDASTTDVSTSDASTSWNTETNSVKLSYESPSDDMISSEFAGYYGNYLVLKTDNNGGVIDADVYSLTRKAVVTSRVAKYVDSFALAVSGIDVNVSNLDNGALYSFTYPLTNKKVTYFIGDSSTTMPKHYEDENAELIALDAALDITPTYTSVDAVLDVADEEKRLYGVNFLSYNYVSNSKSDVVANVANVHYFKDACADKNAPVSEDNLNTFIVTDDEMSRKISVGDFVNNIAFNNEDGEAQHYKMIPGLSRIINKIFVQVSAANTFTYKGQTYEYAFPGEMIVNPDFGTQGFYLFTAIDAVKIEDVEVELPYAYGTIVSGDTSVAVKCYPIIADAQTASFNDVSIGEHDRVELVNGLHGIQWEDENGVDLSAVDSFNVPKEGKDYTHVYLRMPDGDYAVTVGVETKCVVRQLPLSSDVISKSLRWIPMKGLKLSSRHKPGYDANGNIDIEGGIKKIYSVLEDAGIRRGLLNSEMIDYRYIVDSFGYGLDSELGGKVYLSKLAKDRGKCTALLNLPSQRQLAASENPYFCDTYVNGAEVKPAFNTKYMPIGGNAELYATRQFSLPSEENGSKFAAAFWPYVQYSSTNGKKLMVPPAGDISNIFMRKFQGGDPYCICANMNGIFGNNVVDVEYLADQQDRDYLEPMGVNTIIRQNGAIMIYGNQTCYQTVKSDYNKLHIRENLNTLEIECEAVLKRFNFLYNTAVTRAAIVTALTPICQAMQNAGAIYRFKIVCDETNNTSEVIQNCFGVVDIEVEMAKGMEKIIQRITLQKAGTLEA